MFFGKNRTAYLEFLRNLTPQIIFLTATLFFGEKINPDSIQLNWSGIKPLLPCLVCAFVFYSSLIANYTLFLDNVINTNSLLEAEKNKINARYLNKLRTIFELLKASWKLNKQAFLNGLLVFIIILSAQLAVSFMAVKSISSTH
jgi:hypothetical protein